MLLAMIFLNEEGRERKREGGGMAPLIRFALNWVPVNICGICASLLESPGNSTRSFLLLDWEVNSGNESADRCSYKLDRRDFVTNKNVAARPPWRDGAPLVEACDSESKSVRQSMLIRKGRRSDAPLCHTDEHRSCCIALAGERHVVSAFENPEDGLITTDSQFRYRRDLTCLISPHSPHD